MNDSTVRFDTQNGSGSDTDDADDVNIKDLTPQNIIICARSTSQLENYNPLEMEQIVGTTSPTRLTKCKYTPYKRTITHHDFSVLICIWIGFNGNKF